MSSSARKMRRTQAKLISKSKDVKAAIHENQRIADMAVEQCMDKWKNEESQKLIKMAQGNMVLCVLAFLHLEKHHTGAYLKKFTKELVAFSDQMQWDGVTARDIGEMLKEHTGFDFPKVVAECVEQEGDAKAQRSMTMRWMKKEGIA